MNFSKSTCKAAACAAEFSFEAGAGASPMLRLGLTATWQVLHATSLAFKVLLHQDFYLHKHMCAPCVMQIGWVTV